MFELIQASNQLAIAQAQAGRNKALQLQSKRCDNRQSLTVQRPRKRATSERALASWRSRGTEACRSKLYEPSCSHERTPSTGTGPELSARLPTNRAAQCFAVVVDQLQQAVQSDVAPNGDALANEVSRSVSERAVSHAVAVSRTVRALSGVPFCMLTRILKV